MTSRKAVKGFRPWWIILLILAILLAAVWIIIIPWNVTNLASHPHPAQSYEEAIRRIEALQALEPQDMNPVCRLQLMTHGDKVDRTIILVHGYTNCPQQFRDLGQDFYDAGYNVLLAPLPHHGLADRMTEAHAQLTAEELAAYADKTVDISQGLGEQVAMMGISGGGVTTAWAAQNRSDLDLAVIIAPTFGFKQIPTSLTGAAMNMYTLMPDSYVWWDPVKKADYPPLYAYPRYSQHALVELLRIGFATRASAERLQPAAKKLVVVSNANDNAVNNPLTMEVVRTWQAHGANVTTYEFAADLKLGHDLIDPTQPDQRIDIVYPQLITLTSQ